MTTAEAPPALNPRQLRRRAATSAPWTRDQVANVAVLDLAAVVVVLVAAWNAHGVHSTSTGISWLMLALLGLAISGTVHSLFLLRARQSLSLATDLILDTWIRPESVSGGSATHVHVVGSARFHRADCAFVQGRATAPGDGGSAPCEVCQP